MKFRLPLIAWSLLATAIVSLATGSYFDSQCEGGCLFAEVKDVVKRNNGKSHIVVDDDYEDDDKSHQSALIEGPMNVDVSGIKALQKLSYTGIGSEVKIRKGANLAVRAYEYRTDKGWQVKKSGNELSLNFEKKGPERVEIDLPSDFKGMLLLSTISGNLDIGEGIALSDLTLHTTSGDVSTESQPSGNFSINTVSGDITSTKAGATSPKSITLRAVSGDCRLELASNFSLFKANTVSGDINLRLVGKNPSFAYQMHSVSGDFTGIPQATVNEGIAHREVAGKVGDPKDARMEFESVSGDFELKL
jgi:hypothetical protein